MIDSTTGAVREYHSAADHPVSRRDREPISSHEGRVLKEMTDGTWEIPIEGVLDLHTFLPREVKDLVREYLEACRRKGILKVRIIHGKGTGALRETVRSVLARIDFVVRHTPAGDASGWGATLVILAPEK